MASILVNGSPSSEFPFYCGLKQGDPLAPFLFILIMESLHISFSRATKEGFFNGIQINETTNISHLFYADDAVFIGEWSDSNMENIVKILKCFFLASGLKINIQKSQVLGVGVPRTRVIQAASKIGCAVMQSPFRYLGVMVGDRMSRKSAWADTVQKLRSRLSKWKVKTLSIGGLGLISFRNRSLVASLCITCRSYKSPKRILNEMEMIRCNFFKGADPSERKISWVYWDKVLASKKNDGLGVSSFHALNRALLLKWVWRFLSQDGSLWYRVIQALYGSSLELHSVTLPSIWCSILREMQVLAHKGFDFVSHCKKRVGNGLKTRFWFDTWAADQPLRSKIPRSVRDGVERQQWTELTSILDSVILSPSMDRWFCDLNGEGVFRVKEVRYTLDDIFLPSAPEAMRGVVLDFLYVRYVAACSLRICYMSCSGCDIAMLAFQLDLSLAGIVSGKTYVFF
ncbi:RNA-directed DNA polymerase, eukaryota [Tanacetum coccineum]